MTRSRSRARPFYTVDCETDPFLKGRIPRPFLWCLYDGQKEQHWFFKTRFQLLEFLENKNWLIYAHNGGKFDYHYLKDDINSDQPVMVIAGRIAKFKIGQCEFRDSINILINPLRAFAKEEIDYQKLEESVREQHWDEIKRYCLSDCVNLWNTLKTYFDSFGRPLTAAGASMRKWRKKLDVPFRPQTAMQAARHRPFYYGGRVQCFESGHKVENFAVIDINSAYPYAMLENHPFSPEATISDQLPRLQHKIGPCLIKLDAIAKGCFPLRTENNALEFPNDNLPREYSITGHELLAAQECNAVKILKIKEVHHFLLHINFEAYIQEHYNERKKAQATGDAAGSVFHKIFMNSLYGKFASDPDKYVEYLIASDDSYLSWLEKGYEKIDPWGERILMGRKLPEEKRRYFNVATAASITGYVRAMLFRAMMQCEGVLYCDTDSIAARTTTGLSMGNELGQWKLELNCKEYAIAGKKLYAFRGMKPGSTIEEWKIASKGAKLQPADIVRAAQGEKIIYNPEVPTYSIHRPDPIFTPRLIKNTARNLQRLH